MTDALRQWLSNADRVAVAVSGGVDSMTLAFVAHQSTDAEMYHAVSPAVPTAATARVEQYARQHDWHLHIIDAGEFDDETYLANPSNRCYFCKTNLYGTIASCATAQLVSGTNTDDLDDFRPGLQAAKEHRVRHPYVECGIDKAAVREIAAELGLHNVAELPAAPCLSSRVETGIQIEGEVLAVVDDVETKIRELLAPQTVRCRIRSGEIVLELDSHSLEMLSDSRQMALMSEISQRFSSMGLNKPVRFSEYQRGSAFLVNLE